jgi:uncharacterized membrane protein (UPF0136 family)
MYLINPGKRKKSARRKKRFASKNPTMKTRRRRRRSMIRRNPIRKRRRRFSRRNPSRRRSATLRHALIFPNSGRRRRRRFSRANPVRRRRFIRRNPASGIGGTIFDRDTMVVAGGVVVGTIGTNLLLNALLLPNPTTGVVRFALPGVNTTNVNYMNSVPVALYKFAIGGLVGYALRNSTPRLAQGIVIGAFAGALSSVLQSTNLLANLPGGANSQAVSTTAGVSRFFKPRAGAGSFLPGTNPIFTGPASGFLRSGSPLARNGMRRPGMGAMFNAGQGRRNISKIPSPW